MRTDYRAFLKTKITLAPESGFEVRPEDVNPALKPHQRDSIIWAARGGQRLLAHRFGLGKTADQLELGRLSVREMLQHPDDPRWADKMHKALFILPLGVRQEFVRDAGPELLGWDAPPVYVTHQAEAEQSDSGFLMTNYERVRDGDINPNRFGCVLMDEAAVMRDIGSKSYQVFREKVKDVPLLFMATATPDPNGYDEILNYAHLLGVMDRGQALTRFFKRDSAKAGNLTLHPSQEDEFWLWVSSWAMFLSSPADLGYDATGYDLPPLRVRWHEVAVDAGPVLDRDGQVMLERDVGDLSAAAAERRESMVARVAEAKRIVDSDPDAHFILWHDLEDERKEILRVLPEAVDIYGQMDYEERERRVIDFSEGRIRLFATKKSLSGSGCNFQRHCHRAIFIGVDDKFESFIQAIHRIYRFLQKYPVEIDIIITPAQRGTKARLLKKWKAHDRQMEKMTELIRKYGLDGLASAKRMERKMGVERVEVKGNHFRLVNNDCVEELAAMEENSVDFELSSIPFGNQYEYSANYNDFGHNATTDRFFEQLDFLTPHKLRVLKPGRICCVHVKDRIQFGSATGSGSYTVERFSDKAADHYEKHGFLFCGRITVTTDVVRENKQTNRLGWSLQCRDGTRMGVGMSEYILIFRKPQTDKSTQFADEPVEKSAEDYSRARWQLDAHGYWRSGGDRLLTKEEMLGLEEGALMKAFAKFSKNTVYDYAEHVAMCEGLDAQGKLPAAYMVVPPASWDESVWDDILRIRTLNTSQSRRNEQLHVCPLQLDLIERLIERYSAPGDVVLDEFCGIGSVPYMAVKMGRYGLGVELANGYFRDAVGYCEGAEAERDVPTLFDLVEGI